MIQISFPARVNTLFWEMTVEYITCKCLRRLSWREFNSWELWSMIGLLFLSRKKNDHSWSIASGEKCGDGWLFYLISPGVWVQATEIEAKWNIGDTASMTHNPCTAVKLKANEKEILSHWLKKKGKKKEVEIFIIFNSLKASSLLCSTRSLEDWIFFFLWHKLILSIALGVSVMGFQFQWFEICG